VPSGACNRCGRLFWRVGSHTQDACDWSVKNIVATALDKQLRKAGMLPAGSVWRQCKALGVAEMHPTKDDGVEVYWASAWAVELSRLADVPHSEMPSLADAAGRPNPGWADALKAALRLRRSA
jgi:hypothetical protein